jgi:hypothetical protein
MVKLLHTAVWAFLAGCIVALLATAWLRRFDWAAILTAIILIECAVLGLNRGRCPLTDVAARYTSQDSPNADIYLPAAKHNKTLFGTLFVVNELVVLWRWLK